MFLKFMLLRRLMTFEADDKGGGAGDDKGGSNGDGSGKKPDEKKPPEKVTFTAEQQAAIDQLLGDRAQRAADAAHKKLLEDLGLASVDDAKKALDAAKQLQQQQLSDLDKAKAEATDWKTKAEAADKAKQAALDTANEKLLRSAVLAEAVKPEYKIKADALPDLWAFIAGDKALRDKIKPNESKPDEYTGIGEAIKELVKAKAYLVDTASNYSTTRRGDRRSDGQRDDAAEKRKAAQAMQNRF